MHFDHQAQAFDIPEEAVIDGQMLGFDIPTLMDNARRRMNDCCSAVSGEFSLNIRTEIYEEAECVFVVRVRRMLGDIQDSVSI